MEGAGATLSIDLQAIADNYRMLAEKVRPAVCAAVVKADAYGLGADRVAPALAAAGCRAFFVAHASEGVSLRRALGPGVAITVLHGPLPGDETLFLAADLIPVLNSAAQAAAWAALSDAAPCVVQVDTGMSRLGLPPGEFAAAAGLRPSVVMSHLACADDPSHPANAAQRDAFLAARALWPGARGSLAASSGIFLGPDFHMDMTRPGAALYGVAPRPGDNPMRPVVALHAAIVQCRDIPPGASVGYGYRFTAVAPTRVATAAIGYADGFSRRLSNRGVACVGGTRVSVIGRVSMDSITLDVSALPRPPAPGTMAELIGPNISVDEVAAAAGTIGYEILTALGHRFARRYLPQ